MYWYKTSKKILIMICVSTTSNRKNKFQQFYILTYSHRILVIKILDIKTFPWILVLFSVTFYLKGEVHIIMNAQ